MLMVGEEVVAMSLFGRRSPSRGGQEVQDVSNHRAGARRGPAQLVLRVGVPALIVMSLLVVLPTAYAATPPPKNTSLPTISGTPLVAQKLTASTGSWTGKPTRYAYQWQRCNGSGGGCTPISGATSSSYTVSSRDVGGTLVVVTATNAGGSGSAGSAATAVVQAAGNAAGRHRAAHDHRDRHRRAGAQRARWPSGTQPISYSYQWQRCNSGGGSWHADQRRHEPTIPSARATSAARSRSR